jgi:hypothetical protein
MTPTYRFQPIREVGRYRNDHRYRDTSISDSGKATFIAHVSPIEEVIQIGDDSGVETIATGGYEAFRPPVINKHDQVVFWSRNADTGESIQIWDPSDGLTTAMNTESDRPVKLGRPSLNNEGTIAFTTALGDGSRELRRWNSGSTKKILDDSGDYLKFSRVDINDRGVIAFRSIRTDAAMVILAVDQSELIEVKDLSLIHVKETSRLAINNSGTIVFTARKSDDSWWLYAIDASEENSKPTPLASTTEPLAEQYELLQLRGDPGINSRGEVMFWADYKLVGGTGHKCRGLFIVPGPDPLVLSDGDGKIEVGDETYEVHDLWADGGINDDRMVSFWFSGPSNAGNKSFVIRAVPT